MALKPRMTKDESVSVLEEVNECDTLLLANPVVTPSVICSPSILDDVHREENINYDSSEDAEVRKVSVFEWIPRRYIVCFLCFLAMNMTYIMRFCISIAITEMVVSQTTNLSISDDSCPYEEEESGGNATSWKHTDKFDWDEETQGIILSSFYWGYVVTQVPAGLLAERVGGKYTLGGALLLPALCSILTPLVARQGGAWGLIVLRVVMGLGQGFVYPSLNVLLAKWAPLEERGRLGSLVFIGAKFGNVVSMSLSGLILSWTDGVWDILFYLYGGVAILWLCLWMRYGYSKPEDHPGLSTAERKYLDQYSAKVHMKKKLPPTPWKQILTSVPLWGCIVAQIGDDWGLFTIVTDLPKYMKTVLHFSIAQTGLLSALPNVAIVVVAMLSAFLVDFLLIKKITKITASRKTFTTIGFTGPAVGIICATYAGCDRNMATVFFVLGMGLMGFFHPSLKVNCLDLSPNYAGSIMAVVNTIGAVSGIISPYIVGLLITDNTMQQWRHVFLITAAVLLLTNLFYVCTASGEVQSWNNPASATDPEQDMNLNSHTKQILSVCADE